MRTTITLDDEIVAKLKRKMGEGEGKTFKEAVNETLSHGFLFEEQLEQKPRKPFKVQARDLRLRPGINLDKISSLLEMIEGPDFK